MQGPTTLTRRYEFHRILALAIGIVLLAALILAVVALNRPADSSIAGEGSNTITPATTDGMEQITFLEQNVWEYAAVPVTGIEQMRFLEQNDFQFAAPPMTNAQIKFMEDNDWEYAPAAQVAQDVSEPTSTRDFRFLEENDWEYSSDVMLPIGDAGELDY
ncbi:MAG: hypothetical protein ACOC9Y_02795 [Chloroflexota bacterium]